MSSGKKIFVEIEWLKLDTDKPEFPQGFKFKWLAFDRDKPSEKILFDNHTGKKPHYHVDKEEKFFTWKSRKDTQQMFYQEIIKKWGNFIKKVD
jgi:hypothetical protein